MKHIKLFEDYTDDDLRDLIGDLQSVGHSSVPMDIDYGPLTGMRNKEKDREMETVESWDSGGIKVKSGSIKVSLNRDVKIVLNMTNGDILEMEIEYRGGGTSFTVNGEFLSPLQYPEWGNEYPYTLDALVRYEHYLASKTNFTKPSFLQRMKKKLGLSESYSDDELMDLIGDLKSIGQSEVPLDIDYGHLFGMKEKDKQEERDIVNSWSLPTPGGEIEVKSGSIKVHPDRKVFVILNLTNGDVIETVTDDYEGVSFSVNGNPILNLKDEEDDEDSPYDNENYNMGIEDYPHTLAALTRYERHLANKSRSKTPTFLQRIKAKLGLKESYSEEELMDLMGDLRGVGHSNVIFNVDMSKAEGDHKVEKDQCENWVSYRNPGVHVVRIEGHIINKNAPEDINLKVTLSNGDKFEFEFRDSGSNAFEKYLGHMTIFTGGKEIKETVEDEMFEYDGGWILSTLKLYDDLI
jgi:hypothetical protein